MNQLQMVRSFRRSLQEKKETFRHFIQKRRTLPNCGHKERLQTIKNYIFASIDSFIFSLSHRQLTPSIPSYLVNARSQSEAVIFLLLPFHSYACKDKQSFSSLIKKELERPITSVSFKRRKTIHYMKAYDALIT